MKVIISLFWFLLIWGIFVTEINGYQPNDRIQQFNSDSFAWGVCKTSVEIFSSVFLNSYTVKLFQYYNYYKNHKRLDKEESWKWGYKDMEILIHSIKNKAFEPNYFCEVTLPICNHDTYEVITREDYQKRVLADKPEFIQDNNYINNLYKEMGNNEENKEKIILYHLSDLHWDLNYTEGAGNTCGKIVCCRKISEAEISTEDDKAGKWGDYHWDSNPKIIEQLDKAMKEVGTPDIIIWTGDNADHGVNDDPEISTKATKEITQFFNEKDPNNVVFAINGNHELASASLQNFTRGPDPAINLIADAWKDWLSEVAYKEFKERTFYSMLISEHPKASKELKRKLKNVRVIAYNSENWDFYNRFVVGELGDSMGQMEWLENLLRQMEKDGEIGILFAHISPGMDACFSEVSSKIQTLMDRFQHVLRLNLFGHTHKEEFEVVRAIKDGNPIGVNHLAPSLTTINTVNPSFRVFTLDASTLLPLDVETFTLDILKANEDDKYAVFSKTHTLKEEYGMENLSPQSFYDLTQKFADDEALATQFQVNRNSRSPAYVTENGWDETCRRKTSCITSNSVYSDVRKCYNWSDLLGTFEIRSYIFDFLYGVWVKKK